MRALYLHERLELPRSGDPHLAARAVEAAPELTVDLGAVLVGSWTVMSAVGNGAEVVNIWELPDGWDSWRRLCGRSFLGGDSTPSLTSWWTHDELLGGARAVGSLLGAVPGCPSLAGLVDANVGGELFRLETTTVRPGAALDYLDAVEQTRSVVLATYGHQLVGMYENVFDDSEAIVIWASSLESHVRLQTMTDRARGLEPRTTFFGEGIDDRLSNWIDDTEDMCLNRRVSLLLPVPGSPLAPTRGR